MKFLLATSALVLSVGAANAASVTYETDHATSAITPPGTSLTEPGTALEGDGNGLPNIEFGQTWTASESGYLESFGFSLRDSGDGLNDLVFNAKIAVLSDPDGTDGVGQLDSSAIGSFDYIASDVSSTPTTEAAFNPRVVHTLTSAFEITAGTTYALVFEAVSGGPVEWRYFDNSSSQSATPDYNGTFIYSAGDVNSFAAIAAFDSDYQVTYRTAEVPVAAALPLMGSGLAVFGLLGLRRRRG